MGENQLECMLGAVNQTIGFLEMKKKKLEDQRKRMVKTPWVCGPEIKKIDQEIEELNEEANNLLRSIGRVGATVTPPVNDDSSRIVKHTQRNGRVIIQSKKFHNFEYIKDRVVLPTGLCYRWSDIDGTMDKRFDIREATTPTVVHPAHIPEA